jgi:hypothetical protein
MSEYGCSGSLWIFFKKEARLVMNQGQSGGANRTKNWVGKINPRLGRRAAPNRKNTIRVRLFWD